MNMDLDNDFSWNRTSFTRIGQEAILDIYRVGGVFNLPTMKQNRRPIQHKVSGINRKPMTLFLFVLSFMLQVRRLWMSSGACIKVRLPVVLYNESILLGSFGFI